MQRPRARPRHEQRDHHRERRLTDGRRRRAATTSCAAAPGRSATTSRPTTSRPAACSTCAPTCPSWPSTSSKTPTPSSPSASSPATSWSAGATSVWARAASTRRASSSSPASGRCSRSRFARIFFRNAINVGLPVLQSATRARIEQWDELEVDLAAGEVRDLTTGAVGALRAAAAGDASRSSPTAASSSTSASTASSTCPEGSKPPMTYRVTLIPGDGTGPELAAALETVIAASGVPIVWERPRRRPRRDGASAARRCPTTSSTSVRAHEGRHQGADHDAGGHGLSLASTWRCARSSTSTPACGRPSR